MSMKALLEGIRQKLLFMLGAWIIQSSRYNRQMKYKYISMAAEDYMLQKKFLNIAVKKTKSMNYS
jgi:hypothetical protein